MAALVREALDSRRARRTAAPARAPRWWPATPTTTPVATTRAQPWYEASRRHAIAEGDESHLSALMHNLAWLRASQVRAGGRCSTRRRDDKALAHALMGAESIGHYDAGIGTASLGSLVPMLRAQVLTAQGRWRRGAAPCSTPTSTPR